MTENKQPKRLQKLTSLFISPTGERVAVAAGNQITILQKDDDYTEPFGIFTGSNLITFTTGAWSENHDVLGVTDDIDTLYFIKANGQEITRIVRRHLKVSCPIISLIANDDYDAERFCLCGFTVFTSDGFLRQIEISQDPIASINSACTSYSGLTLKGQFPLNVFCVDYHLGLLLVVGVSGSVSIQPQVEYT